MPPSFLKHITLISQFELERLFATRKGLLSLLTFAVVWFLILYYPIRFASNVIAQSHRSFDIAKVFEFFGFESLLSWHIVELGVYWHFALIIFPTLSVLIAADQTCSDRQRGTLRFLALRTSKDRLFFGRFSGIMLIQAILILATLLSTLALVVYRDIALLTPALNSAFAIMVNLLVIILPFTAMMAALSAALKSPRQTTIWAILILSFLSGVISLFSRHLVFLNYLKLLIPGNQLTQLGQLAQWDTLQLAYIPLLQTIVFLAAGRWVMSRQAI
jgi:hypothetical protein